MVSAQIQRGDLADAVGPQLSKGPYPLTGANTILVLGSDARSESTAEPGSEGAPSRSDSIMLLRIGGGANASLSIPRDTIVDIPGQGRNKINAAYAFGGPALATETVKDYLGVEINHVVEVSSRTSRSSSTRSAASPTRAAASSRRSTGARRTAAPRCA